MHSIIRYKISSKYEVYIEVDVLVTATAAFFRTTAHQVSIDVRK